ncbi:MAG: protoporphyrinogen oxidase [Epsilonproteobacteria bacterium]|nr:protoporphyrinogen oxidase [Campylobacterota bacterium]
MKVAIVGAGISGLASGYYLQKMGFEVDIYEKERIGGKAYTHKQGEFLFEEGVNGFLDNVPETLELASEIGVPTLRANQNAKIRYIFDDKLYRLPSSPKDFLFGDIMPFSAKLRMFKEFFIPPQPQEDESVASFTNRRLGEFFTKRFMTPMTAGIYASTPQSLSINAAFPKIAKLEKEYGGLFRGMLKKKKGGAPSGELTSFEFGMSEMIEKLAKNLNIIHKPINSLEELCSYDKIILATPAYESAKILKSKYPTLAAELAKIDYTPVAIVGFSGDIKPEAFGILTTQLNTLGILMDKYIFPHRGGIRAMVGGERFRGILEMSKEEIIQMTLNDIEQIIPNHNLKVEFFKLWKQAIPNYKVGHLKIVRNILDEVNKIDDLYLNSNAYRGVSFNDCIKNSKELAASIKYDNV